MQPELQIDDLGFCPSFSCYNSDSLASTAAARISSQLQQQQQSATGDEDFDFSFLLGDEESSDARTGFPLFNRDLLVPNEENVVGEGIGCSDSLAKLFINEREESGSSSSDESDGEGSGAFCLWKSGSTGSGSKRWRIRDLLRRSNSEVKEEPMVLLSRKKVEISKQKRSSGEVAGKLKPSSASIHELLYVQRAKRESGKRKSYLPYRQGLVGLFSNVNGSAFKLPF